MRSNIDSTKHDYSTKIQSYRHIFTGYVYKKQPEKNPFPPGMEKTTDSLAIRRNNISFA